LYLYYHPVDLHHRHRLTADVSPANASTNIFFFFASGVGLSPLYCGHFWPIVPAPDVSEGDCGATGKPKYSEETCPTATLSTTNPT
jgi:hypothetical protein